MPRPGLAYHRVVARDLDRLAAERERLRAEVAAEVERLQRALREAAWRAAESERELSRLRARGGREGLWRRLLGRERAPVDRDAALSLSSPLEGGEARGLAEQARQERERLEELRRLLAERQAVVRQREREVEELRARLELARRRLAEERRALADRMGRLEAGRPGEVSFGEGLRRLAAAARCRRQAPPSR